MPIAFSGERLEINCDTARGGAVTVEVLDAAGRTLPGFERSEPVRGDSLRHRVSWARDVRTLGGKPVTLRFHLQGARLYAFAFRDA